MVLRFTLIDVCPVQNKKTKQLKQVKQKYAKSNHLE